VCTGLSTEELLAIFSNLLAVLYVMSKKLAQILSLPLVLHNISAPRLKGLKQNDPKVHKSDNVAPEVALVSIAIVILKLIYGLDGRTR
jgi:RNA polymerase I-specific transcription initiation factor RRN7